MGLDAATSRSFGKLLDNNPNTIQQSVLPNAHRSHGNKPLSCAILVPTMNDPAPAHVAAMLNE